MIKKPAEMINTENRFRVLIAGYPRNRENNTRTIRNLGKMKMQNPANRNLGKMKMQNPANRNLGKMKI